MLDTISKKRSKFLEWVKTHNFESISVSGDKDPLLKLLIKAGGDHPILLALLVLGILTGPTFITARIEGVLINDSLNPDLIRGIGNWMWFPTIIIGIFSIKFYTLFERVFYKLYKDNVLELDHDQFNKNLKSWNEIFNNRHVSIITYAITIIVAPTSIWLKLHNTMSWEILPGESLLTWTSVTTIPLNIFGIYILVQFALRLLLCFFILQDAMRNIRVHILHPDNCGGLGAVGELSMLLNVQVFIVGIIVAGSIFSVIYYLEIPVYNISTILALSSYLFFSFFIVFTPLYITHNNMRKARDRLLNFLNYEFEIVNKSLQQKLCDNENHEFQEEIGKIEKLRNLFDLIHQQPVWPFNISVAYSFVGSILPPFIIIFLETFIKQIL